RSTRLRSASGLGAAALLLPRARLAVLALALAEVARQLGGEGVAGRKLGLLLDRVGPPLELLDVRGGLLVAGDRLADLLLVCLGRPVELGRVDLDLHQAAETVAERGRSTRARRE